MNLIPLIERLEEIREELEGGENPNPQVRLAYQEHFPLASNVRGVALEAPEWGDQENLDSRDRQTYEADLNDRKVPTIVWLVQGGSTDDPYRVPRFVWEDGAMG